MKILKHLYVCVLILFFSVGCVGFGIHMPTIIPYLIAVYLIVALAQLAVEPFLRFLTIKANFVTYFLMSSLALVGLFYLFDLFMVDFAINTYDFAGTTIFNIHIPATMLNKEAIIAIVSVFDSFLVSIFRVMDNNDK